MGGGPVLPPPASLDTSAATGSKLLDREREGGEQPRSWFHRRSELIDGEAWPSTRPSPGGGSSLPEASPKSPSLLNPSMASSAACAGGPAGLSPGAAGDPSVAMASP